MYGDDMWMTERRHNLDLSADVHHVLFVFYLLLTDGFDCHLRSNKHLNLLFEDHLYYALCHLQRKMNEC